MSKLTAVTLAMAGALHMGSNSAFAQEQTFVNEPIGQCAGCRTGEGMVGHAVNVPPVPKGTVFEDWPGCDRALMGPISDWLGSVAEDSRFVADTVRELLLAVPGPVGRILHSGGANCAPLAARIPARMRITRVALTYGTNGVGGPCAEWEASPFGELPTMADRNRCEFAWAGYGRPVLGQDDRTVAVVFRNWSDTNMVTPFLRVFYRLD